MGESLGRRCMPIQPRPLKQRLLGRKLTPTPKGTSPVKKPAGGLADWSASPTAREWAAIPSPSPLRDTARAMSQENVELIRRLYQAFSEGQVRLDFWHPDAELRPALLGGGLVEGAVYRGHEGASEFLAMQAETWETMTAEPLEIRDLGTFLLVETRLRGVGRASGIELSDVTWNVFEVRDGKVAKFRVFTEKQQALEAVGLTE